MRQQKPQPPKNQNLFFMLSFLPAVVYWWLEEKTSPGIALAGGVACALVEMGLEKIWFKKIHTIAWLNFFLIAGLGGLSFLADSGIWFKLQPFFTSLGFATFVAWKKWRKQSLFLDMLKEFQTIPVELEGKFQQLEVRLALFVFFYGCKMAYWALWGTTAQWTFWKTIGFYICFFVYMVFEMFFLHLSQNTQKGRKS
jgi:intracellular septation protein